MNDLDLNSLCPGIQRTVGFLRSHGFNTTDSGDGYSNEGMEGAMPFPNVAISCSPENLVQEARRLMQVLADAGLSAEPLGPSEEGPQPPHIEASYDPSIDVGFIVLLYVDDNVLFGGQP
jgi:hypothetical protein